MGFKPTTVIAIESDMAAAQTVQTHLSNADTRDKPPVSFTIIHSKI